MPKPQGMSDDRKGGDGHRREDRPRFEERRENKPERERPKIERSQRPGDEGEPEQQSSQTNLEN